jgi:predicted GNAT family acetyltransferase
MPKIALAGYRKLSAETAGFVDDAVRGELSRTIRGSDRAVVGVTCLAQGADQLLARAVSDLGGELEVVIPACSFCARLPAEARPEYQALLARSRTLHHLPAAEPDDRAYREAGYFMLVLADQLLAVWDGTNPHGGDATAGVVAAARARGLPVTVVWPTGARRV